MGAPVTGHKRAQLSRAPESSASMPWAIVPLVKAAFIMGYFPWPITVDWDSPFICLTILITI